MALLPLAAKDANGVAQSMVAFQDASSNNIPSVTLDTSRAVYRASASFVPVTTGALTLVQVQGSATKTVRITRVIMSGSTATTVAAMVAYTQLTSTAGTTGTAVTPTIAKLDTNSPTATAVVTHYTTAAQTVGTLIGGPISFFQIPLIVTAVPTVGLPLPYTVFPENGAPLNQCIVLRGTAQYYNVVNSAPANFANAPVLQYTVEWIEDAS
ncbi:MAG TPA: hypothetical protein VMT56_00320 [Candidatus Bathyarchaeia archaeon]|nr:hypothetical protein [Candidatus Bathyarchaeia archaeon]